MAIQVTLSIPDLAYHQAEQVAQATQRPVEEVLAETIQQAFPPFHVSDDRPKMQEEEAAYEALHPTLLTQYRNQYVAIHQGVVVDHAPDEIELVERVQGRYPDQVVLIRKVGVLSRFRRTCDASTN